MPVYEIERPSKVSARDVVYYLSVTLRNADGSPVPHYFIDSSRAALRELARSLSRDNGLELEFWLDWVWRDMPGGQADRRQISTKPWADFSDPKRLIAWTGR